MKLKKLLKMYVNASSALMSVHMANKDVITVSRNVIRHVTKEGRTISEQERNEDSGEYPWIILLERYGETKIKEFSTYDNTIIFWEEGAL